VSDDPLAAPWHRDGSMSKAFVKDDADEPDPLEAEEESRATRGNAYITPGGFRKLQEELEFLWRTE
jgi:hypothetical protein